MYDEEMNEPLIRLQTPEITLATASQWSYFWISESQNLWDSKYSLLLASKVWDNLLGEKKQITNAKLTFH